MRIMSLDEKSGIRYFVGKDKVTWYCMKDICNFIHRPNKQGYNYLYTKSLQTIVKDSKDVIYSFNKNGRLCPTTIIQLKKIMEIVYAYSLSSIRKYSHRDSKIYALSDIGKELFYVLSDFEQLNYDSLKDFYEETNGISPFYLRGEDYFEKLREYEIRKSKSKRVEKVK